MAANLKQGNVYTFQVPQNSTNYQVRVASTPKGLWMCIEESFMQWKLTISPELLSQIVEKATMGKEQLCFKQFVNVVLGVLRKTTDKWSIGIMTAGELELLRGGTSSKVSSNNKLYLILSEKTSKLHLPFTFIINDLCQNQKMEQAIKSMKEQLEDLKTNQNQSQSSLSIMSESNVIGEQIKAENEELKKNIRIYEEALTQKRGAVEIDTILREKNNLELRAATKKRDEAKQIIRLKNIYHLMQRQIHELKSEMDIINKQLMLIEDSMTNPVKIKSHALKVLKSYETELRTSKKVVMKQTKQVQNLKRNLMTSKNNERKNLQKIKQIQQEIDQAKKKANVREISNRLHSPGSRNGSSVNNSQKAPSVASDSSDGKGPRSTGSNRVISNRLYSNPGYSNNLVRQNLLKRKSDTSKERSVSNSGSKNLMKTTPNINLANKTPLPPRKTDYKPPVRPVVSSHQSTNQNTRNNPLYQTGNSRNSNDSGSVRSASSEIKKKQFSPADRQRQKKAMQRLTGKPAVTRKSTQKINNYSTSANKPRNTSNTKPTFGSGKKDSAKEILNRMKQVRNQYNNRSRNSAAHNQQIAQKVAYLTQQK